MDEYNTGEAYAFFDCNAPIEKIRAELPFIRDAVQTPKRLELALADAMFVVGDPELLEITREAKEANMKYVMKANYPNATNKKTADELASILYQAYQSPLYNKNEEFRGEILYRQGGEYHFRE